MMFKNAIKYGLLCWVVIVLTIYGCSGAFQFSQKGAEIATNAVTVAQGLLHALDGFYGDLLTLKIIPDYTNQATRALSIADQAAAVLKAAIAGATVTDEQLNVAAGQVDGAMAILGGLQCQN